MFKKSIFTQPPNNNKKTIEQLNHQSINEMMTFTQVAASGNYMLDDDSIQNIDVNSKSKSNNQKSKLVIDSDLGQTNEGSQQNQNVNRPLALSDRARQKANTIPCLIRGLVYFQYEFSRQIKLLTNKEDADFFKQEQKQLFDRIEQLSANRVEHIPNKHKHFYVGLEDKMEIRKKKYLEYQIERMNQLYRVRTQLSKNGLNQKYAKYLQTIREFLAANNYKTEGKSLKNHIRNSIENQTAQQMEDFQRRFQTLKKQLQDIERQTFKYILDSRKVAENGQKKIRSIDEQANYHQMMKQENGMKMCLLNPEAVFHVFSQMKLNPNDRI